MSKDLLNNIETHLQDEKSKVSITALVSALDARRDAVLPKVLSEKLELVKNNPIDEKDIKLKQEEIEKMLENEELDISEAPIELLEAVYTIDQLDKLHSDGITLTEFQKLGVEINKKVFNFKYLDEKENYVFKEVDSHKNMAVLSFHERKEIRKLSRKVKNSSANAMQRLQKAYSVNKADDKDYTEKVNALIEENKVFQEKGKEATKELSEKAMKYSGLDKNELSEWEQKLAIAKVVEMAEDKYTPPMGKN